MTDLFSPRQVRAMDERAYERGVVPSALMDRAAHHLTRAVLAAGGRSYGLRVGVLCGRGNNGGDGLASARQLLAAGAAPRVALVDGEDRLASLPAEQLRRYREAGGRLAASPPEALRDADVGVDCLLGTGSSGELRDPYPAAVAELDAARSRGAAVVACDLPSGVDADTGAVAGPAVRADVTVTLGAHKRGLWLDPARHHCGRLLLGDLGIVDAGDAAVATALEPADVAALVQPVPAGAHKYSRGAVVVVAGSPGMSGAATLVARGAMAAGAGLVTVATSAVVRDLVAPTVPEALSVALPDGDVDAAMERLAPALAKAGAVAVGPGLGRDEATVALIRRLVASVDVPVVLDADGLNAFAGAAGLLADSASPLLVCTPHQGELRRLRDRDEDTWPRRAELAPRIASEWNAVLVAKGPGSLIAAPDGRVWINPTGGPGLATGGSGDVLSGMTATLVAQRRSAEQVAATVWLHGLAGQLAGQGRGARAVTATGIIDAVGSALRSLDRA